MFLPNCPVCGGEDFNYRPVLWSELATAWALSEEETGYINRQQGFYCTNCLNNLRAMALADTLKRALGLTGSLEREVEIGSFQNISILEVNPCGALTKYLEPIHGHKLIAFPDYDLCNLSLESDYYDFVIHSDTLEHVPDPLKGLKECRRVLKERGRCVFTIPIVTGRQSRSRAGLQPSYHGNDESNQSDLLVHTEFGSDAWTLVLEAGFRTCAIHSIEFPAGLAVEAYC